MTARRPLLLTPGDPLGIGPEITCSALVASRDPVVVIGDHGALVPWARRSGLRLVAVDRIEAVPGAGAVLDPGDHDEPGRSPRCGGRWRRAGGGSRRRW
ncbi:MAG TPA: hypothetical protein ENK18_02075 [Deltaproteobacteria bacterium]|nr:hypothetical protein [Deltaproteobacteria bacterium]